VIRAAFLYLLSGVVAVAQSTPATRSNDVWKKAGASDNLRRAFERTLYSVKDSGHGIWRAENRGQHLTVEFDSTAAHFSHPEGSIGVPLTGYGYGDRLEKPAPVAPIGTGNRVEYRRGDLTEWYMNAPPGLEQGFTLRRRPVERRAGEPLAITLEITGDLSPEQKDGAVLLRSAKSTVLRYAGLTARDYHGRALPSRLKVTGHEIQLLVQAGGAQYPLAIDPTWTQQTELTASDGKTNDGFGTSVAVSGPLAVIGSPSHTVGSHAFQGSAYVFVQSGTTWSQQAELISSDGAANDSFGNGVSVDGGTAVIGAFGHSSSQGSAYVFVQSGTTWSQQAELTASDGAAGDSFGVAVSVSGGTALIGAYEKAFGSNTKQGAAYVFVQSGTSWTQQAELTASDGAKSDSFGNSVSVSGGTALVGAYVHKVNGNAGQGAAYVFVQSGTTWPQQQELTASDGAASDQFGHSVSVDSDTVAIGAYRHSVGSNSHQGAAYVFVQSGTSWSQQQELTASDGAASDLFGWSVAVRESTLVVGADAKNSYEGAAYVFTQSGTTWTQQQELTASDGATSDSFGWAVAVRRGTVVSSAYAHTVGANSFEGATYVFTIPASLSVFATHSSPIFQAGPGTIALSVANAGSATAATATVSDTIDPAFTIGRVSSGCTFSAQTVTCTVASGSTASSTPFGIFVTASATASASIDNTATLTDITDTITTSTTTDTITVMPEAPLADSSLTQLALSGSTDNGSCADGNLTLTATDLLQNTGGSTLTNPYAVIGTLSGGNSLISQSASSASVVAGATETFTFHIQLASCNRFQLFFDVRSN
jgi:nucleoside-specific outer membrane channel protein Tsx